MLDPATGLASPRQSGMSNWSCEYSADKHRTDQSMNGECYFSSRSRTLLLELQSDVCEILSFWKTWNDLKTFKSVLWLSLYNRTEQACAVFKCLKIFKKVNFSKHPTRLSKFTTIGVKWMIGQPEGTTFSLSEQLSILRNQILLVVIENPTDLRIFNCVR